MSTYIDIDSTYRNRNEYPYSTDFVIPIDLPSGRDTFNVADFIADGASSGELKESYSFVVSSSYGANSAPTHRVASLLELDPAESTRDNIYVNRFIEIINPPIDKNNISKIVYYQGSSKSAVIYPPFEFDPSTYQYKIRRDRPALTSVINPYYIADISSVDPESNSINNSNSVDRVTDHLASSYWRPVYPSISSLGINFYKCDISFAVSNSIVSVVLENRLDRKIYTPINVSIYTDFTYTTLLGSFTIDKDISPNVFPFVYTTDKLGVVFEGDNNDIEVYALEFISNTGVAPTYNSISVLSQVPVITYPVISSSLVSASDPDGNPVLFGDINSGASKAVDGNDETTWSPIAPSLSSFGTDKYRLDVLFSSAQNIRGIFMYTIPTDLLTATTVDIYTDFTYTTLLQSYTLNKDTTQNVVHFNPPLNTDRFGMVFSSSGNPVIPFVNTDIHVWELTFFESLTTITDTFEINPLSYVNQAYISFSGKGTATSGEIRRITSVSSISPSTSIISFFPSLFSLPPEGSMFEIFYLSRDNASTLKYPFERLDRAKRYEIQLMFMTFPNEVIDSAYGGRLDNYPYIYISLSNEGNTLSSNLLVSNNRNSSSALFKIPVDRFVGETKYFVLKNKCRTVQRVVLKPDASLRIRVILPNGEILRYKRADTVSPLRPDPFLQISALFKLKEITE